MVRNKINKKHIYFRYFKPILTSTGKASPFRYSPNWWDPAETRWWRWIHSHRAIWPTAAGPWPIKVKTKNQLKPI